MTLHTITPDPFVHPNRQYRELDRIMEFGHVIRVLDDNVVDDAPLDPAGNPVHAPAETIDGDYADDLSNQLPEGWSLLSGYTGQDSYNGPVMHDSEYVGGGLARDILSTPGYYVALDVTYMHPDVDRLPNRVLRALDATYADADADEQISEGWVIAYRETLAAPVTDVELPE